MSGRGLTYLAWGSGIPQAEASAATARQHGLATCLVTDHYTGASFDRVVSLGHGISFDPQHFPRSPWDVTLFLHADTFIQGPLDHAFEKAEQFGLCLCLDPTYEADCPHYDLSVLFFDRRHPSVDGLWEEAGEDLDGALTRRGLHPYVLPRNWNFRPDQGTRGRGPLRIWHAGQAPPAELLPAPGQRWSLAEGLARSSFRDHFEKQKAELTRLRHTVQSLRQEHNQRMASSREANRKLKMKVESLQKQLAQAVRTRSLQPELSSQPSEWLPETICILLGPYRNLTTLTGSLLQLHPHCQVLNHGYQNIVDRPELDFLQHDSPGILSRFCHYALSDSTRESSGSVGGSILAAHAFASSPELRSTYRERFGESRLKETVTCLAWKDSQKISRTLRDLGEGGFEKLLERHATLRFLLPRRNPLECTASTWHRPNMARALVQSNLGEVEATPNNILRSVLNEFRWFLDFRRRYPERFFSFSQDEVDGSLLDRLGTFLKLQPDPDWVQSSLACYQLRPTLYQLPPDLLEEYPRLLEFYLGEFPEVQQELGRYGA